MTKRRYRVTGEVQGVGFRWFTTEAARGLGIQGTVRNAADGSVEVLAAGPAEALDAFAEKLRAGPPGADVRGVEEEMPPPGDEVPGDFRILS